MTLTKVLSITALLAATSLATPTPAKADVPCQGSSAENLCLAQFNRRDRNYDYFNEINQIYREVLGREVDSDGLRTYSRKLDRGDSLRDVREDVADSREARDAVARMYRELAGRNPSSRTVRDYTRRLAGGSTLSDIRADIVRSDDFRDRNRGRRAPIIQPPVAPPTYPGSPFPGRPPINQTPSAPPTYPGRPPINQPPIAPPPPPPGRPF
jgi:hypothetical protein